jgi:hypothetical protein
MRVLFAVLFVTNLVAFNFNFGAPPAKEEIMEPSVLGEVVNPKKEPKKIDIGVEEKRDIKEYDDTKEEPKTIYVEHRRSTDLEGVSLSYPKVALIVPRKVIKKYANSVADSLLAYMINKKGRFELELFDCGDESQRSIVSKLDEIRSRGFKLVIAPMTQRGARVIAKYETNLIIYIPTVNKKEVPLQSDNIFFGGIDYEEQIDKLLTYAGDKIAIFNDKSALSQKIASFVKNAAFSDISYEMQIRNAKVNLAKYLKNNHKLDNASIFLNMPIVKTSLLASQLNVYDSKYKNLLLTQIAYNPLIFTLTQKKDREKMYIANSIGESEFNLKDINLILGTNIDYSWVNYSTLFGIDYFYTNFIYDSRRKGFKEEMVNNQVSYKIELLKPSTSSFVKIRSGF